MQPGASNYVDWNEASARSALVSCFISCIQKHRASCRGLWPLNMKHSQEFGCRIPTHVTTSEHWPSQDDLEAVALAGSVSSAETVLMRVVLQTSAVPVWCDLETEIAKRLRRQCAGSADKAVPEASAVVVLSMQISSTPRKRYWLPKSIREESEVNF